MYSVPHAARGASSRKAESRSRRSSIRSRARQLAPLAVPGRRSARRPRRAPSPSCSSTSDNASSSARVVGAVRLRAGVDGGGEDGHERGSFDGAGRSCRRRKRGLRVARRRRCRRGKNRPMARDDGDRESSATARLRSCWRRERGLACGRRGPKPLHRLCGRPMVLHVLDSLRRALGGARRGGRRPPCRVGDQDAHRARAARASPSSSSNRASHAGPGTRCRWRSPGCPTTRATTTATWWSCRATRRSSVRSRSPRCSRQHRASGAAATLLTAVVDDPAGYGRVVRGRDDAVARVVEHEDATDEEREVLEVNTSIYCFKRSVLAPALRRLTPSNAQGEYYLTDLVDRALRSGAQRRLGGGRGPDGGRRGQRPGPARRRRGRAARPDQRALDAPRGDHVGPADDLRRRRRDAGAGRGPPPGRHPAGRVRDRRARGDRAELAPGRHHGRRGRGGRVERLPPCDRSAPTPGSARSPCSPEGTEVRAGSVVGPSSAGSRTAGAR